MKKAETSRWVIPVLLGGALAAAALLIVSTAVRVEAPAAARAVEDAAKPKIQLANGHRLDTEARQLTDLEPLFLPTHFNTSVLTLPAQVRKEPGSMSFTFPPFFAIGEAAGGLDLPAFVAVPETPAGALRIGQPPNPFAELVRSDAAVAPVPRRLAHIEVRAAGTGQTVFNESIPAGDESTVLAADWTPLELMLAVDNAGLVGAPAVTRPTTSEEIQEFFRRFVVHQLHLGARLTPGFYTVHIGP